MMDFRGLGKLLAEERRKSKYTQEMVAEIVGVTDKTIRNIEYGLTAVDLVTLLKLLDLYGISGEILFLFYIRDEEMNAAIRFFEKTRSKKKTTVYT